MIFFSIVGYGKHMIKINFDDSWLEFRDFTVNVSAKEGRSYFLRP